MVIGGIEKMTLIDYPGHLAAIIFTEGCNFRCRFCYNPKLVLPLIDGETKNTVEAKGQTREAEDGLFDFLKSRQNKLDGVVITGGEPTLHPDLPEFIKKIKALGFLVKLDTNGTNPVILDSLIKDRLIDYIAMDIKSDKNNYKRTVGVDFDFNKIEESVKIIINSGLPHEFRTTCVPEFHNNEIILNMAGIIKGAQKWYLQSFKSDTDLVENKLRGRQSFSNKQMEEFTEIGNQVMGTCYFRK